MNRADYRTIEMAVQAFDERAWLHSGEKECTVRVGLSREHLDTLSEQWAGVDLTRFMQSLTLNFTRQKLQETRDLPAGSRLPEPCCQLRSLSAEQGKRPGAGLIIRYGFYPSPFGDCLQAMTGGGEVCHLAFVDDGKWQEHLEGLRHSWPQATIIAAAGEFDSLVVRIFSSGGFESVEPLCLLVKGTTFQFRVWQALLALPFGTVISYQELTGYLGHPTACRAVAVAANPVSCLIPCHRVIRKSGEIHHYRWGDTRKKMMLGWEACAS